MLKEIAKKTTATSQTTGLKLVLYMLKLMTVQLEKYLTSTVSLEGLSGESLFSQK